MNAEPSRLAAWLLREADDARDSTTVVERAERSFHRLCTRLSELATPGGCQAFLNRAIRLAAADFPFLRGMRAGLLPGACLEGVHETGQGVNLELMKAGLIAVMAQLIGLLERFIGEDLLARLVRDTWPDAPLNVPNPESHGQDARL